MSYWQQNELKRGPVAYGKILKWRNNGSRLGLNSALTNINLIKRHPYSHSDAFCLQSEVRLNGRTPFHMKNEELTNPYYKGKDPNNPLLFRCLPNLLIPI